MAGRNWTRSRPTLETGDTVKIEFRVLDVQSNPDGSTTLRLETVERTAEQAPIPFVLTTRDVNYHPTGG